MHSNQVKKILFLCTGNSCRSQMAEAWAKSLRQHDWHVFSAGIEQHGMNPNVLQVMGEEGIDMSSHYSKTLDDLRDERFDVVVTVCDGAAQNCPIGPNDSTIVHAPFDDPPKLALGSSNEVEKLDCYRRVRDEIKKFVEAAQL